MAAVVAEDRESGGEFIASVFSCAPEQVIYSFVQVIGIEEGDLSKDEVSCFQERLAVIDWSLILDQDSADPGDFIAMIFECVPDPLISLVMEGFGIRFEELSDVDASCLRERLGGIDWAATLNDEKSATADLISNMIFCVPGQWASRMISETGLGAQYGFNPEDLSDEDADCFRDRIVSLDWGALGEKEPAAMGEFTAGLYSCAPKLLAGIISSSSDFGVEPLELTVEQVDCLGELADRLDWAGIFSDNPASFQTFDMALQTCLPDEKDTENAEASG